MVELEDLYFEWLLTRLNPDGVREGVAYLCGLLHNCEFERRVGNDSNRADDGINLRWSFLEQFSDADFGSNVTNALMDQDCSWFEMLVALAEALDYLYEGGVEGRFLELVENMGLGPLIEFKPNRSEMMGEYDQRLVDVATSNVDKNKFDRDGRGGLFPLKKAGHPDQREVEIWDQHAAYFRERLEGVLWTSTS
jgi:hypothetical protein